MGIRIEVDYRERPSGMLDVLQNRSGIEVEEKKLSLGDYRINGNIVVERKTTTDFIISIIDGRLFSQISRLKKGTERPVLIIEGTDLYHSGYKINPQAIKGAIISVSVAWYIPLIFSKNLAGTADFLLMTGVQNFEHQSYYAKRFGRKPKSLEKLKLHALQGLPQVGPKIAGKLLEYFGSIEKVIVADESDLANVEGIGCKKARLIKKVVG